MSEFKINDFVFCIDPRAPLSLNKIYKVKETGNNILNRNIIKINGNDDWFYLSRFKLASISDIRKIEGFGQELEKIIND